MKKLKQFIKNYWQYLVLFLLIGNLARFFLYTGDDWFWASDEAITYLQNGFKYYNARFISNIISMFFARHFALKCLLYGLSTTALFKIMADTVDRNNKNLFYIAIVLFFLIDNSIFAQGFVWSSGYVNYTLPIMFLIYLIKATSERKLENIKFIPAFILGLIFTSFLENISVLLLVFNFGLWAYSKIKKEKRYNLGFFLGTITGLGIMTFYTFAYRNTTMNRGIYLHGVLANFVEHALPYYFGKSFPIIACLVFSLIYLAIKRRKQLGQKFSIFFITISIVYILTNACCFLNIFDEKLWNFVILAIYTLSSLAMFTRCTNGNLRMRIVLYYSFAIIYIIPIAFVEALGPRLMLFPTVMNIMLILEVQNIYPLKNRIFSVSLKIFSFVLIAFYTLFYYQSKIRIQNYYREFNHIIEENITTVYIKESEFDTTYHFYIPIDYDYLRYYTEFYDIDTDLQEFNVYLLKE